MPKELTAEQKAAYLLDGWSSCPFCASPEISGGHVDIEGREAWQNVDCTVCGAAWRDVYHLAEIEVIDAPETIPEAGNRIDQLTEQIIPAVDAALAPKPKRVWVAQHIYSFQPFDELTLFATEKEAVAFVAKNMSINVDHWVSIWEGNPESFYNHIDNLASDDKSDYYVITDFEVPE